MHLFNRASRIAACCAAFLLILAGSVSGQDSTLETRTVRVNGKRMRTISSASVRTRVGGPVVVLEAGFNSTAGSWRPVLNGLAQFAPVFAYDRSGLGESEFDGVAPTLAHLTDVLHALLAEAHVPPPYVLVGHSWGGAYVRAFADRYPSEVVGVAFIEATDFERTEDEERAELPAQSSGDAGPPAAERFSGRARGIRAVIR